ncbi:MAG: ABC transporter permease [Anaerolineaceae bacterium]|nr:MAG: ABC transporter permease [Chloroflexi bacterium HGW-Chloroflexi-8]
MSEISITPQSLQPFKSKTMQFAKKNMGLISIMISVLAILLALLIGAILIALAGVNPWEAYGYLIKGSFGNRFGFGETLTRFVPLLFASLSFAVAHKSGFFNVGAEGQIYIGAIGALLVGAYLDGIPAILHVFLCLLAGFIFGAIWAGIAGVLKVYLGSNELINTMMLNYVAIFLVEFLIHGPLKDPELFIYQSKSVLPSAKLPIILSKTPLHLGFVIALIVTIAVFYLLYRTPIGYQMRTVGANLKAASYAGINIIGVTLVALITTGGLAGIGGAVELMGAQFRMVSGFSPGYGFDGIGIAVMGRYNPVGIVLATFLFAVIRVGTGAMQRGAGVPFPLLSVIQGLIIIFVIASGYLTSKLTETVVGGRA